MSAGEDHFCVAPGCGGIACFGFGAPFNDKRWACRDHKDLIWSGVLPSREAASAGAGGSGDLRTPPARGSRPPGTPQQGRLFG